MPNRILKETICTSDTLAELTEAEENFFYRLMVQCDDYGLMDARPAILRARCYPLHLDRIDEAEVRRRLQALIRVGLVWIYEINGRPYLQMTTWEKHQQRRAQYSKYPRPPEGSGPCKQLLADDIKCEQMHADDSEKRGIEESRSEESRSESSENGADAPPTPPPAPEAEKPKKAREPRSEAVQAFREVTGTWPNRTQIAAIDAAVTPADIPRWQEVMRAWLLRGYKPVNVQGMLEWLRDGVPVQGGNAKNGNGARAAPRASPANFQTEAHARLNRIAMGTATEEDLRDDDS